MDLHAFREQITEHISEDQRKQKERYDKVRREVPRYQVGNVVIVEITSERPTGESRKLLPKFKGPFKIFRVIGNDRYEVENLRESGR